MPLGKVTSGEMSVTRCYGVFLGLSLFTVDFARGLQLLVEDASRS